VYVSGIDFIKFEELEGFDIDWSTLSPDSPDHLSGFIQIYSAVEIESLTVSVFDVYTGAMRGILDVTRKMRKEVEASFPSLDISGHYLSTLLYKHLGFPLPISQMMVLRRVYLWNLGEIRGERFAAVRPSDFSKFRSINDYTMGCIGYPDVPVRMFIKPPERLAKVHLNDNVCVVNLTLRSKCDVCCSRSTFVNGKEIDACVSCVEAFMHAYQTVHSLDDYAAAEWMFSAITGLRCSLLTGKPLALREDILHSLEEHVDAPLIRKCLKSFHCTRSGVTVFGRADIAMDALLSRIASAP